MLCGHQLETQRIMDYKTFKGTLLKSIIIVGVLGAIVLLMGVGTILYMLTSPESSVIGLSLFGGLFILLGGFFLYKSGPAIIRILTDTHPVLKGIKDGERDAILWLYQKQIETTAAGQSVGTSNNISLFLKNGDSVELILGSSASPQEMMDYIQENFDIPYIGYSEETRVAVTELLGRSVKWQKM
ncbi:MAG: sporulation protein YlmC with PRC-barrel domain [Cognaticolwellia sp.]|jgi:sporulation protein YlmC with PRC-barrel domain